MTAIRKLTTGEVGTPAVEDVINALVDAANGGYTKPDTGIPSTDMTAAVQASLGLADSAVQPDADYLNALALAGQAIQTLGGLFLKFNDPADGSSAAAVTAAAVGAKTKVITVTLEDSNSNLMTWFAGPITLTPAKSVVDSDVGLPTVTGGNTKQLVAGTCQFTLVYDTDEGVAKTYAEADTVSVSAAIADIFGETPDVSDAEFIDTLVA